MFNKIVVSVISSVVLFACNVKEDASVAADAVDVADVGASNLAPATPATPIAPNTPQPTPSPVANIPTQEVVISPLVVNGTSAGMTVTPVSTQSTASIPAPATNTASAPSASTVAAPATSTTAK